jgi:hypothetical protein
MSTASQRRSDPASDPAGEGHASAPAAPEVTKPTQAQRRYLVRGLDEPGGKLPLFDRDGRAIPKKTVESCLAHGWAEPWRHNPIKPDWLVCRLTAAGYRALGVEPPPAPAEAPPESQR